MDEQRKKAFEFAQDVAKQLITLATAVIAITLTYGKDFAQHATGGTRHLVAFSWYFFLVSILFGLVTLMALTGNLESAASNNTPPSIRTRNVTGPAAVQIFCFLSGMLLAILFGVFAA
jgi:hypothetical protein